MTIELNAAQEEFLQSIEGDLTPAQSAQLLELGYEGDTGKPEPGGEPVVSTADDKSAEEVTAKAEADKAESDNKSDKDIEHTAENTVILARDGKHTIGFEKLEEARTQAQEYKAKIEEYETKIAEYEQKAQERADAGKAPTEADEQSAVAKKAIEDFEVDPEIFGDFSEADMAKGIATLNKQLAAQIRAELKEEFEQELKPLREKEFSREQEAALTAEQAHFKAIIDAHSDANSILESQEFDTWLKGKPGYEQKAIDSVLDSGTAQEVVEVFSKYKDETGKTQPGKGEETDPEKVKAAAQAAIDKAKPNIPATLTDIPGGRGGDGATREEQMANMEGAEMLDAMEGWSKEQIQSYLNRQI